MLLEYWSRWFLMRILRNITWESEKLFYRAFKRKWMKKYLLNKKKNSGYLSIMLLLPLESLFGISMISKKQVHLWTYYLSNMMQKKLILHTQILSKLSNKRLSMFPTILRSRRLLCALKIAHLLIQLWRQESLKYTKL